MKNYITAAIIAVGLLALGLCVRSGLKSFTDQNRVVAVRGLAEREVMANKVTWPISFAVGGNDLAKAYGELENVNEIVTKFLKANGLTEDEFAVGAPIVTDLQADRYSSNRPEYRYSLSNTVTVSSEQIELVRGLILKQGDLIKKGIAIEPSGWSNPIEYEYTELNTIKPDMIAEATRNAREAAKKFADDSGSKIGKIKDAQQGQFSIENRDEYTPFIKKVRVVTYVNYYIED